MNLYRAHLLNHFDSLTREAAPTLGENGSEQMRAATEEVANSQLFIVVDDKGKCL
jgi:hypothetical protein